MAGKLKTTRPTRRDAADAARLQRAGTHGDTILAHINPQEARLLDKLADGLLDGGGRNPTTGLLSFGMSDGESGRGDDSNPGGVGGGPAGGNTGGGIGGNTEGGLGGLGGGYDGSTVDGRGGYSGVRSGVSYGRLQSQPYDAMKTPIESLLAAPNFTPPGMSFTQYAPRDTLGRAWQEYFNPSVRAPGRFDPPDKNGPGIMGGFVSHLAGGPFSAAMNIGGAMGRASSKETQEASAAEDAARSAHNSNGQQQSHSVLAMDELMLKMRGAEAAGSASGANTTGTPPPGYTLNPAGQIVPMAGMQQGDNRPAWKDPVENLLYDYIWRGPSGRGW